MTDDESDFIDVAVEHGLLQDNHAAKIRSHAKEHHLHVSDAALTLSMLQANEVEAVNLLCRPNDLAPGYELTGLIGCGAGGIVFRARQTALDREVALKTINPRNQHAVKTSAPRIQREAHAIAKLRHPGIVAAFDSGFHQGRFCIAMELVEGENLVDFIQRQLEIPERVVWEITRQVAYALLHACEAGIIHRDIKPANLLLCTPPKGMQIPEGVPLVKVADFGLATDDSSANQITATGATLGTPAYVAPEQLGDPSVDVRADIYSLGATVFHMLNGRPPCVGQSPMKTIMQKSIGDDRWRDDIRPNATPDTIALFRDMTEADPEQRIPNHETLIERVDQLLSKLGPITPSAAAPSSYQPGANSPWPGAVRPGSAAGQSSESSRAKASNSPPTEETLILDSYSTVNDGGGETAAKALIQDSSSAVKDGGGATAAKASSRVIPIGVAVLAVASVIAAGDLLRRSSQSPTSLPNEASAAVLALVPDGFPYPLFNGSSVPLFRQSGAWSPVSAEDGSRVLAGESGAWMTIPVSIKDKPAASVRLRVSVNLADDSEAEVAVTSPNSKPSDLAIIRLSNEGAKFALSGNGAKQTIDVPFPVADPSAESTVFRNLTFVRHESTIQTFVNGEYLGQVLIDESPDCGIQLRPTKGTTEFADIDIVAMK